jgi:hypothetical protein
MVCKEVTKIYTGSGGTSHVQWRAARVTCTFIVKVTNGREMDRLPGLCGSSVCWLETGRSLLVLLCPVWDALSPLL